MSIQHWFYGVRHENMTAIPYGRRGATTRETLCLAGLNDEVRELQWHISSGFKRMVPGDVIWFYALAPDQTVGACGIALEVDQENHSVWFRWHQDVTEGLAQVPFTRRPDLGGIRFTQVPQSVQRLNSESMLAMAKWKALAGVDPEDEDSPP
jgi:hypothetical protein